MNYKSKLHILLLLPMMGACAPYQALLVHQPSGDTYFCLSDRTLPVIAKRQVNKCVSKMTAQGYVLSGTIKQ